MQVTGSRQYSHDISQEIPCILIFTGDVVKAKKAMSFASAKPSLKVKPAAHSKDEDVIVEKEPAKLVKVNEGNDGWACANANQVWVCIFNIMLKLSDQEILPMGQELTDTHMNAALAQNISRPENTFLNDSIGSWTNNYIQVMHC